MGVKTDMLKRFLDLLDAVDRVVDRAVLIGGGVVGFLVARPVLAAFEYGVLVQYGGALVAALVTAVLARLVWSVMQLFA
ncbi:MAG: hypothetical protein AAGJ29_08895 [Pseudomonadota bacterium]